MTKFNKIYNLILEELTDKQKELTDKYTAQRDKNLSFGPLFKEERNYFPFKSIKTSNIEIPEEIEKTLDNAGFYITDYRAGIAMKKTKPGEEKDLRQIKIGKILQKLNQPNLLKQFNERLGTSKKDIQNINFEICITHNPYDIAGMSTDRNWTSCMELDNGEYKDTPLYQVQYGGMCAYLISNKDKNIEKPFARIAIKRFISKDNLSQFIFAAEDRIYGDVGLANEIGFQEKLIEILDKSNSLTTNISGEYLRKDSNSYSDTYEKNYYWFNSDNLNKQNKDTLLKYIESAILKYKPISCEVLKYAIKTYPNDLSYLFTHLDIFYVGSLKCYNIDKELIELLLKNNIITLSFKYAKDITTQEANNLILKYSNLKDSYRLIFAFLENKNIKFTQDNLDKILNILINNNFLPIDVIKKLFTKYKLSNELLHKYLPLIIEKDKLILKQKDFLLSQDFPADVMIKYCDNELLSVIYKNNKHLSKENKKKLKRYLDQH